MHRKNLSKFIFLTIVLSAFFLLAKAQVSVVKSEGKVILEGKVFYMHPVKAGQTLYSISKAYGVTEEEITRDNPGSGLKLSIGQVLKIPADTAKAETNPEVSPPDTIKGTHLVRQGETMYSIAKFYGITIEELEKANPEIKNHVIGLNQLVKIPEKEAAISPQFVPENYTIHKVRRKETVFGIAKMYNISEELLIKYNPELLKKFPKPGQTLKIPRPEVTLSEPITPIYETQDSIAGFIVQKYDTAAIANNYAYYLDSIPEIHGRELNVAYLIPFNFRSVEEQAPLEVQRKTKDDMINLDHESNPNDQMLSSRNFLEFMEGSLLAIDSLKNVGISVNVFFYDTQKSPTRTREILYSKDFQKIDLIIGPFYSYNVEIVSEFSRLNKIPMVSPLSGDIGPITVNPFFFQLNPGYKSEYDRMADYITHVKDKNIVFIHGVDSLEMIKYNYLKENLLSRLSALAPLDSQFIKEVIFDRSAKVNLSQDLQKVLSRDSGNLVVVPETDEAFVSTVVTQLYFQLKNYDISVLGMPHWSAFQNIDFLYYHKLSLTYFTPYYFSYTSPNVKHFLKDYRKTFYSEPVTLNKKGGSYAFLGYDLSYYFLKLMNDYGKRFILHLDNRQGMELMNNFRFVPVGGEGGFENRSLMLVKYNDNMDIIATPYEIAVPAETHSSTAVTPEIAPVD
jgi:LysM repeat protein